MPRKGATQGVAVTCAGPPRPVFLRACLNKSEHAPSRPASPAENTDNFKIIAHGARLRGARLAHPDGLLGVYNLLRIGAARPIGELREHVKERERCPVVSGRACGWLWRSAPSGR